MVSFSFEPWRSDTKIDLCSETYCFELKDKEHRIHVYLRESGGKTATTLIINMQKKEGYEKYVKKMLELIPSGVRLEDNQQLFLIYKSSVALFTGGGRSDVYVEWEEEGMMIRAKAVLDKRQVYVLFKAFEGPYEIFYQTDAEVDVDSKEHDSLLRYFLTIAVYLHRLFKEYVRGGSTSQQLQEKV